MKNVLILLGLGLMFVPMWEVTRETLNHSQSVSNTSIALIIGFAGLVVMAVGHKMRSRLSQQYLYR